MVEVIQRKHPLPPIVEDLPGKTAVGPKLKQAKQLKEGAAGRRNAASTENTPPRDYTPPRAIKELRNSPGWTSASSHAHITVNGTRKSPLSNASPANNTRNSPLTSLQIATSGTPVNNTRKSPLKVAMDSMEQLSSAEKWKQHALQLEAKMEQERKEMERAHAKEKASMQKIVDQKTKVQKEATNSAAEEKAIAMARAKKKNEVCLFLCVLHFTACLVTNSFFSRKLAKKRRPRNLRQTMPE